MLKYLTIISGFIYLIFSIVVLFKKSPLRKQNRMLGIVFMLMALYSVYVASLNDALVRVDKNILSFYFPIEYVWGALMGPVFYFYIVKLLRVHSKHGNLRFFLHSLPVIPSIIYLIYFSSLPAADRISLLLINFQDGLWSIIALNVIFYIQMTSYLILSYRHITRQIKLSPIMKMDDVFYDISWLKVLVIIDLFIMVLTFPVVLFFPNEMNTNVLAQLTMDIQLIYIFIRTFWESGLFPKKQIIVVGDTSGRNSSASLIIADEIADVYLDKIKDYMERDKPFLKEDCTLQMISDGVGIQVHQLSSVLNRKVEKNFSDFVNEYRVLEARRILQSRNFDRMTIEAIGFECGFGSKSNFNKAFKKLTNMTPSEFRTECKTYNL